MGALRHMFVAMRISPLPGLKVSRRRLLVAGGLAAAAMALTTRVPAQAPADSVRILRAGRSRVPLPGAPGEAHARAGYDGAAAGPLLRVRRDETLAVRLINDLTEPTAVHWHGVRLPNAMDGVPGLTQAPIAPGASFDYRFIPPDAGTFWYHAPTSGSGSELLELDRGEVGELDLGQDFDRDRVGEIAPAFHHGVDFALPFRPPDLGLHGELEAMIVDDRCIGFAHRRLDGLCAHRTAVDALEMGHRHLAGTKPIDPHLALQLVEPGVDLGVEIADRNDDPVFALEALGQSFRNLHVLSA